MVQLELDPEIEQKLRDVAEKENLPTDFLISEVLSRWLEDREDYARGMHALANMKYTISQEEMDRRAELAD
jgi:predicted DNA-binding protein